MGLIKYDQVLLTRRGRSIYVHAANGLETSGIMLHPIVELPERATLLNNGASVASHVDTTPWRWRSRPALRLSGLPVNEINDEPLIVRLDFSEESFA